MLLKGLSAALSRKKEKLATPKHWALGVTHHLPGAGRHRSFRLYSFFLRKAEQRGNSRVITASKPGTDVLGKEKKGQPPPRAKHHRIITVMCAVNHLRRPSQPQRKVSSSLQGQRNINLQGFNNSPKPGRPGTRTESSSASPPQSNKCHHRLFRRVWKHEVGKVCGAMPAESRCVMNVILSLSLQ